MSNKVFEADAYFGEVTKEADFSTENLEEVIFSNFENVDVVISDAILKIVEF